MTRIEQKEKQDFIDEVAKGKFIYSEFGTAKDCYDDAEELWDERQSRIENRSSIVPQLNGKQK